MNSEIKRIYKAYKKSITSHKHNSIREWCNKNTDLTFVILFCFFVFTIFSPFFVMAYQDMREYHTAHITAININTGEQAEVYVRDGR